MIFYVLFNMCAILNRLTPGRLGGVDVQCMTNVQNMTTVLDEKLQARQQLLIPVITHFLTAPAI